LWSKYYDDQDGYSSSVKSDVWEGCFTCNLLPCLVWGFFYFPCGLLVIMCYSIVVYSLNKNIFHFLPVRTLTSMCYFPCPCGSLRHKPWLPDISFTSTWYQLLFFYSTHFFITTLPIVFFNSQCGIRLYVSELLWQREYKCTILFTTLLMTICARFCFEVEYLRKVKFQYLSKC
jgi:hypothetical protein